VHNHTTSAMPSSPDVLTATRHHQMFPVLEASEIGRIARLGERRTYAAASHIFTTGEVPVGAFVLLSGRVDITQRNRHAEPELIVTHGPGSFMGELAQLSGRPSLVDGIAKEPVETLVIQPAVRLSSAAPTMQMYYGWKTFWTAIVTRTSGWIPIAISVRAP